MLYKKGLFFFLFFIMAFRKPRVIIDRQASLLLSDWTCLQHRPEISLEEKKINPKFAVGVKKKNKTKSTAWQTGVKSLPSMDIPPPPYTAFYREFDSQPSFFFLFTPSFFTFGCWKHTHNRNCVGMPHLKKESSQVYTYAYTNELGPTKPPAILVFCLFFCFSHLFSCDERRYL